MGLAIALAVHVVAIVLWIGGVAMVTTVLLPVARRIKSAEERVAFFQLSPAPMACRLRANESEQCVIRVASGMPPCR